MFDAADNHMAVLEHAQNSAPLQDAKQTASYKNWRNSDVSKDQARR
jgi:hypothetical protein